MKSSKIMIILSSITALAALLIVAVLLHIIQNVSTRANTLDLQRSKQSVEASIEGIAEQAMALVGDNARWDVALQHSYGKPDIDWLFNTWGYATGEPETDIYDAVFIIDQNRDTQVAFIDGEISNTDAASYFGPEIFKFTDDLPKDREQFSPAAKFMKTPKGISIVSAAPIISHSGKISIAEEKLRILIFSKTLTSSHASSLGKRLALNGVEIVAERGERTAYVALAGADESTIGYFSWTPNNPGDKAKSEIQWQVLLAVAAMMACMLILTLFSGRLSSRLQNSETKAWQIANEDALTKLPNRFATITQLNTKLGAVVAGSNAELTVIIADLDGFKDVNDSFGHQIGDDLLKAIASGLSKICTKFSATISRLGGDEFAIIISGEHSKLRAECIAEEARKFLETSFDLDGRIVKVGVSIGIATAEIEQTSASDILRCADVAMYAAKARGKNQFCHYEPKLDARRDERISMAKALATALKGKELQVAYQPIVDAKTHKIESVEALARWQLPNGKWVQPDEFISVAEEFGLIDDLGNQILGMACAAIAPLSDIKLSVNISPAQFRNPKFVETCLAIVRNSSLPLSRLELEVTEGYMIDHKELARPVIADLQAAGLKVSLDDFGTGYSSIGYLREYKFDKLKLDKSLIKGMANDEVARSIIQVTTVLARSMNMTVTAEGVEHEEEANLLRLAGCDTLQGYYFGHPQPAQSLVELLATRNAEKAVA